MVRLSSVTKHSSMFIVSVVVKGMSALHRGASSKNLSIN